MNRVACPACGLSVSLVTHGSGRPRADGRPRETYLRVHRSAVGKTNSEESLCPGSGRWVPRAMEPVSFLAKLALVALAIVVIG
jgi:hypothetical protein